MSEARKLIERAHVTHEIDGVSFRCRRFNVQVALEAWGPGSLMVVADQDGGSSVKVNQDSMANGQEIMRKLLSVAMLSPKLGDVDDEGADTVSWLTLGDYGVKLYGAILGGDSDKAAGFPESCGGRPGS